MKNILTLKEWIILILNKSMDIKKLKDKAKILRQKTFNAFIEKGEAHLGGSFSMIETLLVIYEVILKKKG